MRIAFTCERSGAIQKVVDFGVRMFALAEVMAEVKALGEDGFEPPSSAEGSAFLVASVSSISIDSKTSSRTKHPKLLSFTRSYNKTSPSFCS